MRAVVLDDAGLPALAEVPEPEGEGELVRVLACRARDEAGNVQPDEAEWNVGGYANNGIQRVPVIVS